MSAFLLLLTMRFLNAYSFKESYCNSSAIQYCLPLIHKKGTSPRQPSKTGISGACSSPRPLRPTPLLLPERQVHRPKTAPSLRTTAAAPRVLLQQSLSPSVLLPRLHTGVVDTPATRPREPTHTPLVASGQ